MDLKKRSQAISAIRKVERESQENVVKATEDVKASKRAAIEEAKKEVKELELNLAREFEIYRTGLIEETNRVIQEHNVEDRDFTERLTHGIGEKIEECVNVLYNVVTAPSADTP